MSFYGNDFRKVMKYMYIPGDGDTPKPMPKPPMPRVIFPLPGPQGTQDPRPRSEEELAKIAAYFCVEKSPAKVTWSGSPLELSESQLEKIADMFCVESQEQAVIRRATRIMDKLYYKKTKIEKKERKHVRGFRGLIGVLTGWFGL